MTLPPPSQPPGPPPPPGQYPPQYPSQYPGPGPGAPSNPGYSEAATQYIPRPAQPEAPARRGLFGDPLSMALILVIVVALAFAALLGGEFYARHKANSIVAKAVSCVVQDSATASFGVRPFLLQHFTHRYRDMRVETAGNQIREAKGMKLQLRLDDVRINKTAESAGTLGALDAEVNWSADGIQRTVAGMIPLIGGLVSGVTPDPAAGTLEVQGPLGTVLIKPEVADGGLALQVVKVTGLGLTLPRETVQPGLDAFTEQLTRNLPMGIRAESVGVTDNGVTARFATRDAAIPNAAQDPCFAGL